MTRTGKKIGLLVLVVAVLAVGYAVWQVHTSSKVRICQICERPLHSHNKTVGLIDNEREVFCCPTCALNAQRQLGKEVKIIELTDYETDTPLSPSRAYVVHSSRVNLCVQHHTLMDQQKQTSRMDFDRCSPSVIVFSDQAAAEKFRLQHGGILMGFEQLKASYQE